jgi:hypothetical protein
MFLVFELSVLLRVPCRSPLPFYPLTLFDVERLEVLHLGDPCASYKRRLSHPSLAPSSFPRRQKSTDPHSASLDFRFHGNDKPIH